MKLKNAMGEYSEDSEGNEPLILLCDLCRQSLEVLPTFTGLYSQRGFDSKILVVEGQRRDI
jgi:hypothetical protein